MPEQQPISEPASAARAIDALEHALAVADPGSADAPLVLAAASDWEAAMARLLPDLRSRLDRIMLSKDPEAGLDALLACGALDTLLPEVRGLVGFGDGEWRHKDVWKHTKQVVRQAVPRLEVRWAALLHDVGKVKTRSISPSGEVHFFGHAEVGARMFDRLNRRLPLFEKDAALKASVRFLILHHLRANQYDPNWTDSAVRRFAREMGTCLPELLALSRADITTKRPERKKKGLQQIEDLKARIDALRVEDAKVPPLPKGLGEEIMKAFSIPAGRKIGDLRRKLEAAVDAGDIEARREFDYYVEWLRKVGIE